MKKKLLATLLCTVLSLNAFAINASAGFASDVTDDHWAYQVIDILLTKAVLSTDLEFEFKPNEATTRIDYVIWLWRLFGRQEVPDDFSVDFTDLDQFYPSDGMKSVEWAYYHNITTGVSPEFFAPFDPLTREQAFTILNRTFISMDASEAPLFDTKIAQFNDANSVSTWAEQHIQALLGKGIVTGDDLNNLNPQKPLTNAETAALLYRSSSFEYENTSSVSYENLEGWWTQTNSQALGKKLYIHRGGEWVSYIVGAGAEDTIYDYGHLGEGRLSGTYFGYPNFNEGIISIIENSGMLEWDYEIYVKD